MVHNGVGLPRGFRGSGASGVGIGFAVAGLLVFGSLDRLVRICSQYNGRRLVLEQVCGVEGTGIGVGGGSRRISR